MAEKKLSPLMQALMAAPEDDEPLTEEDLEAIAEGERAIADSVILGPPDLHKPNSFSTSEGFFLPLRVRFLLKEACFCFLPPRALFSLPAQKDLEGIEKNTRKRIMEALKQAQANPEAADIRKLKGKYDQWRLRVGDYRVIFRVEQQQEELFRVIRIRHRREAYRKL